MLTTKSGGGVCARGWDTLPGRPLDEMYHSLAEYEDLILYILMNKWSLQLWTEW